MKILKSAFIVILALLAMEIVFILTFLFNYVGEFLYSSFFSTFSFLPLIGSQNFLNSGFSFLDIINFIFIYGIAILFSSSVGIGVIDFFKFENIKHKLYTVRALGILIIISYIWMFVDRLSIDKIDIRLLPKIIVGMIYLFIKENKLEPNFKKTNQIENKKA